MRDFRKQRWDRLEQHRLEAANFPLAILIWGPSDDGSAESKVRNRIREALSKMGHDTRFSEELHGQPGAAKDPIDDETFQAASADLVIMLYGSRGTQTERDLLLTVPSLASKAVVFIESRMYDTIRTKALTAKSWETMSRVAKLIVYRKHELARDVVKQACEIAQDLRIAHYARMLRSGEV